MADVSGRETYTGVQLKDVAKKGERGLVFSGQTTISKQCCFGHAIVAQCIEHIQEYMLLFCFEEGSHPAWTLFMMLRTQNLTQVRSAPMSY